jgi:hypothetical protein
MSYFTSYIYLIIFVKLGFILLALSHIYLKVKGKKNSDLDKKIVFYKERFEFVFVFLMACLLIYLFNPRNPKNNMIDNETRILLYLFGFILLITAKWSNFMKESVWFRNFQEIVGEK